MTKTRVRYGMSLVYAFAVSALLLLVVALLASASDGVRTRKIVVFRDEVNPSEMAATTKNIAGARMIHDLSFINAIAMELSPEAESAMAENPNVLRIDDDPELDWLTAVGDGVVEAVEPAGQVATWNIKHVHALAAQGVADGKGVRVAVIDTGIITYHPDLVVAGGKSFVAYTSKYDDDDGHGTHVAGILAAQNNRIGVIGVAPGARLYAAKALNFMGWGYLSDVIKAIDWSINKIKASVINMSIGTYADIPTFHAAVRRAYGAGIAVVCAAGNEYGGPVIYPAAYPESIAVSATNIKDHFAYFSSAGPEVDISAPGEEIFSTYVDAPIRKPGYAKMSGTSMATPHVAGAAALLISADPSRKWTPKLLKETLQFSAKDLGKPGPDDFYGAGLLDVNKAVRTKK